jgi:hypothetical protein
MRYYSALIPVILLLLSGGCSNTRFLTEDQLLYTGQEGVNITIENEAVKLSSVRKSLQTGVTPKPNNSLFGRRILPPIGLWVHNYWKDDDQKKLKHWIYKNVAKPPVLISDVQPELRAQIMENNLFDRGYFDASARAVVDTSERNSRKAGVRYFVEVDRPFRYAHIEFDSILESIDSLVKPDEFRNRISPGDQFNLDKLTKARNDLARQIQDGGYYYFNQDYIQLDADTALGNRELNLKIRAGEELPDPVLSRYYIDSILIYISRSSDSVQSGVTPVRYDGLTIFSPGDYLQPEVLRGALFMRSGDRYSNAAYQNSISRLNNLGVFSYVKINFESHGKDSLNHLLNVRADLIMADHINLNLASDLVIRSTGFIGPGISAAVSNNNTFNGAERIEIAPTASIEWQWGPRQENQLGTFSYELGLNSRLTFPRFVLPGKNPRLNHILRQETALNLNFNVLNRTQYYSMFSALTSLKFSFSNRQEIKHSVTPVYLNSVSLLQTTPAFDSVIDENIYIKKSFEEQFILGLKYDFSYDNTYKIQPHTFYFQAGFSSSGNLLDLLSGIGKDVSDRPYTFLHNVYSQHLKLITDFRYYLSGYNKTLATRLYAGVGLPYGNSTVLPYVEQFFSGGAYSLRGFGARTLGPGAYHEVESSYIDQSGDIKLEANLEFRFGISKIVKGAVFLETGNIWLINEDVNRPGSQFSFPTFLDQLAVGTGVGLRFDFNFFVLRTDLGFPLRTPCLQEDKNWLPGNQSVLSNRLFYFAIGYPF